MIHSNQTHLPVVAVSHPGMTGKNNEDRYSVTAYRVGSNRGAPALLAVLCDGIGGHRAGEVAADLAVRAITQVVSQSSGSEPMQTLQSAIQTASQAVYQASLGDENRKGMGATCAVAWIIGRKLFTATVGDSRLYLLRGGAIRQLSTDHTWIQEALDRGYLQPDQVRGHPNAHVIRRYLGSPTPPRVDFRLRLTGRESDSEAEANQGLLLQPGDRLVLCSDGLTDMVDNESIAAAFKTNPTDTAAKFLLNRANQNGGLDNITIIAIEVPPQGAAAAAVPPRRRLGSWGCVGTLLALLVLAAAAVAGLVFFRDEIGLLVNGTPTPTATSTLPPPPTQTTPTPAVTPPGPDIIRTLLPTLTPTRPFLPAGGPTLTPWPTNTPVR